MSAINTPTYMRLREQLREDIVSGVWALGSHLTLAELAAHYEVSAAPVREALLQLQGEGVIDMRMNRGAVVPVVDARYIDNLYRLRGAVQAMLAQDAARLATPAQVERMQALRLEHEAAVSRNDVAACVRANRELHKYIDGLADNPLALDLLEGRSSLVDAFRRARGYGVGRLDLVVEQHRALVDAIAAGNADAAYAAAIRHTDSSRLDLLELCNAVRH